jgi:hypothetical protein
MAENAKPVPGLESAVLPYYKFMSVNSLSELSGCCGAVPAYKEACEFLYTYKDSACVDGPRASDLDENL